jgi:hypothetical protein
LTDLEINAIAEGIYMHLTKETESPLDGISILGVALLLIYQHSSDGKISMEKFSTDFANGLLASWKARSEQGSETIQ